MMNDILIHNKILKSLVILIFTWRPFWGKSKIRWPSTNMNWDVVFSETDVNTSETKMFTSLPQDFKKHNITFQIITNDTISINMNWDKEFSPHFEITNLTITCDLQKIKNCEKVKKHRKTKTKNEEALRKKPTTTVQNHLVQDSVRAGFCCKKFWKLQNAYENRWE